MAQKIEKLLPIMQDQPVIPVLKIDDINHAVPLARALTAGGLKAIEVTLRTPIALDAIKKIAEEVPEAIVGAGTILNATQFKQAELSGARFIVSPGLSMKLVDIANDSDIPMLPGSITPSEFIIALENGYRYLKFFPAEQAGGIDFVKALASPFADLRFCPTGGISIHNAKQWLSLPNVTCIGGSWVAPNDFITAGNWAAITTLAQEAFQLR